MKIAVLDDYLHLSQQSADWSKLASTCDIKVFDRRLSVLDEAAEVLKPFDIIFLVRERMPVPRTLIERLPNLKMIGDRGPQMRFFVNVAAVWVALFSPFAGAQTSSGQPYPSKVIRIINPFAPGGSTDIVTRAITERLIPVLKQQVIVEHRPGAMTNLASEVVAKSPPDGYTMLMGGAANAIGMSYLAKPPYDTLRDFEPVILCLKGANVLSIHPSLPAKNLKELIAIAKAQPGQLNFSSSGLGSSNQMAGELLKVMTGIHIVHVPYKGNAPALVDTVGGHVDMIFSGVPSLLPHIESGRLRAIAIGSLKRFSSIPKVPTFDESGVPGYESTNWFGLLAPAKTPKEIVQRLNVEVEKVIKSPELSERFIKNDGLEPIGGSPESFGAFIRAEIDKYANVIKVARIPKQ